MITETHSNLPVHPGEYLYECFCDQHHTIEYFAAALKVSERTLLRIFRGEERITEELARAIGSALAGPDLWLGLQAEYDHVKTTQQDGAEWTRELENVALAVEFTLNGYASLPVCPLCGEIEKHGAGCKLGLACARIREQREKEKQEAHNEG